MKTNYFAILTAVLFLFAGCSNKKGCTDPAASNYSSKATKDCCCEFNGQLVLWYTKNRADQWASQGSTTFKFYLDGVLIHTKPSTDYWTGPPTCGESGTLSFTKKGTEKDITGEIEIFDQTGKKLSTNSYLFFGDGCSREEVN